MTVRTVRKIVEIIANGLASAVERLTSPSHPISPASQGNEVGVVFLRWDPDRWRPALCGLHERLEKLERWVPRCVVVDNHSSGELVANHEPRIAVVPGDNSAREFSGFAAGMAALRAMGAAPAVWILANDRFRSYSYSYLEGISDETLDVVLEGRVIAGKIDNYPQPVESLGVSVQRWIKTAFYMVPEAVFAKVGGPVLVDRSRLDEIVPGVFPRGGSAALLPSPPFDTRHTAYLLDFLTGAGISDYRARWYQAFPLDEESWPMFRDKVVSILNEQLFSAYAVQAGFPLLDLHLAMRLGQLGVHHPVTERILGELQQDPEEGSVRHLGASTRLRTALTTWMSR